MCRDRGFTLFELLVVLAIVSLVAGFAVPRFWTAIPGVELRQTARSVASTLRSARSQAIFKNRAQDFILDGAARTYGLEGGRQSVLAEAVSASMTGLAEQEKDRQTGRIRFFHDGSASGGRLTLRTGDRVLQVDVDWLTGHVLITEPN